MYNVPTKIWNSHWIFLLLLLVIGSAQTNAAKETIKTLEQGALLTENKVKLFIKTIPEMNRLQKMFSAEVTQHEILNVEFMKSGDSDELIAKMKKSPNYPAADKEIKKLGYKNIEEFLQLSRRIGLALGKLEYQAKNPGQDLDLMIQQQMQQLESLKKSNPQMAAMMENMAGTVIAMAEGMKSINADEIKIVKKFQKELRSHFEKQAKNLIKK